MELHLSREFYAILEKVTLAETKFFPVDQDISHKFLYLLYKAKLQIQPEVVWRANEGSEFTILPCLFPIDLYNFTYNLHSEYHLQVGHPLTAHLYFGLDMANEYCDMFEVFVEQWLDQHRIDTSQAEILNQTLPFVDHAET